MKNKEKYPNTDDALKAFAEHNKHCKCGCSFEVWLDMDDSPRMRKLGAAFAGMMAGSLILGGLVDSLGDAVKGGNKHEEPKPEKPLDDERITGVECPICHSKNGRIETCFVGSYFVCEDCKAFIDREVKSGKLKSIADSKSFIADLCTKNKKA